LAAVLGSEWALSTSLPPNGLGGASTLHIDGRPVEARRDVGQQTVSPEYFRVMGAPLLAGREIQWTDRSSSAPVAIVNDALAREYFSHRSPIGERIRVGDTTENNPWRTIVGVAAADKRPSNYGAMGWVERPTVFKPIAQDPPGSVSIALRGSAA